MHISLSLRVLIVSHLCIGLICLIWILGYPVMGGHYHLQSELILIENVMGRQDALARIAPEKALLLNKKLSKNAVYFEKLPEAVQKEVKALHSARKLAMKAPLLSRYGFLGEVPLLELLWVMASVFIPIFLLLKKHVSVYLWILPLLTFGYALNNQMKGVDPLLNSDRALFPREDTFDVASTTKESWESYLIQYWSQDNGLENGEFNFNLARIKFLSNSLSSAFWEKKSPLLLFLFLFWNFNFAWQCRRLKQVEIKT